jgi:hypothetical protein
MEARDELELSIRHGNTGEACTASRFKCGSHNQLLDLREDIQANQRKRVKATDFQALQRPKDTSCPNLREVAGSSLHAERL